MRLKRTGGIPPQGIYKCIIRVREAASIIHSTVYVGLYSSREGSVQYFYNEGLLKSSNRSCQTAK